MAIGVLLAGLLAGATPWSTKQHASTGDRLGDRRRHPAGAEILRRAPFADPDGNCPFIKTGFTAQSVGGRLECRVAAGLSEAQYQRWEGPDEATGGNPDGARAWMAETLPPLRAWRPIYRLDDRDRPVLILWARLCPRSRGDMVLHHHGGSGHPAPLDWAHLFRRIGIASDPGCAALHLGWHRVRVDDTQSYGCVYRAALPVSRRLR